MYTEILYILWSLKMCLAENACFKVAPWDNINFSFQFCYEVVYPTDNDFFSFQI